MEKKSDSNALYQAMMGLYFLGLTHVFTTSIDPGKGSVWAGNANPRFGKYGWTFDEDDVAIEVTEVFNGLPSDPFADGPVVEILPWLSANNTTAHGITPPEVKA